MYSVKCLIMCYIFICSFCCGTLLLRYLLLCCWDKKKWEHLYIHPPINHPSIHSSLKCILSDHNIERKHQKAIISLQYIITQTLLVTFTLFLFLTHITQWSDLKAVCRQPGVDVASRCGGGRSKRQLVCGTQLRGGQAAGGAQEGGILVTLSMLPVELVDIDHAGGQVRFRFPGVSFWTVTPPPYQVLHLPLSIPPLIHNPFHLRTKGIITTTNVRNKRNTKGFTK